MQSLEPLRPHEIGDQEPFGFEARAFHHGGLAFERDRPGTPADYSRREGSNRSRRMPGPVPRFGVSRERHRNCVVRLAGRISTAHRPTREYLMRSTCEADDDTPAGAASSARPSPRPPVILTPRPGRSPVWIVANAIRGTWFLVLIHAGAAAALLTSPSWLDWAIFVPMLMAHGLITTVGYHRYFSHRSFKTSRAGQFLIACLCCTNLQRGPLWWAAIHRHHHRHSDGRGDPHSPVRGGFLWAYAAGCSRRWSEPDWGSVRDLSRYPELVWLERLWLVPGLLLAGLFYLAGGWATVCLDFCLAPWSPCTAPRSSTRWATWSARGATRRPTTAATACCWRCSRSGTAGTTTTTTTRTPPRPASSGANSTAASG